MQLVFQMKSYSLKTAVNYSNNTNTDSEIDLERFHITDASGEIKYRGVDEITLTDREVLSLYNMAGEKLGYIKEHLIPVGIPLFEKEVKKCSIYLRDKKIAEIKKSVVFSELKLETIDGSFSISYNGKDSIKVKKGKNKVADFDVYPVILKDGYIDRFIMEYKAPSEEIVGVLFGLAFGIVYP